MLLLSCTGCAAQQWCHLPDDCAHAFNQTQLGWEIQDICNNGLQGDSACGQGVDCGYSCDDYGCGIQVFEDAVWLDEGPEPEPAYRPRIAVGPPPEPYIPPMPPKFLPVPTGPVF